MKRLLRPRIYCHYCGERSQTQLSPKDGRRFQCASCQAINFIDENGEVADVPPDEAPAAPRYARPVGESQTISSPVFCATCLKNQYLYNEALSNYLPEPEDPNYAQCLATEGVYKRQLEDRYPQCCARCAPRVEERLKYADYTAKSDNVRRLLDITRRAKQANRYGWRSMVVRIGGLAYGLSTAVQLLWHLTSALATAQDVELWHVYSTYKMRRIHGQQIGSYVGPSLAVGLLSIWWNPKWQHKVSGNLGRLRGLSKYYQVQVFLMAVRCASFSSLSAYSGNYLPPLHSLSMVFELMLFLWSIFFAIKVDTTPLINWQKERSPLTSRSQFVPPTEPFSSPQNPQPGSKEKNFLIDSLGYKSNERPGIWRPLTPPDDGDSDTMDLDYLQHTQLKPKPLLTKHAVPSPFYGTLPTIPTNRLLHPKAEVLPEDKKAIGLPPGFFDKPRPPSKNTLNKAVFAEPKMFANELHHDTGLESIFGTVFSLKDEPVPVRDIVMEDAQILPHVTNQARPPTQLPFPWTTTRIFSSIASITFLFSIIFILITNNMEHDFHSAKLAMISFGALVPAVHLRLSLQHSPLLKIQHLAYLITTSVLAALAVFSGATGSKMGFKPAAGVMCLMLWSEICSACWIENIQMDLIPTQESFASEPQHENQQEPIPTPRDDGVSTWTDHQQPLSRPRSNSIDTSFSDVSAATTSSTASGWKTPKAPSRMFEYQASPGYVAGFSRLGFDDRSVGNSIARPRNRSGQRQR